jgi:7-cyano-7-deazaguanine reductase
MPFHGFDHWMAYEASWLNAKGKPVVALADYRFDCGSDAIIESKSFKLYLNSFNQTRFESLSEVESIMQKDLAAAAGGNVKVRLYPADQWASMAVNSLPGVCLDDLDVSVDCYNTNADLLKLDQHSESEGEYHSHLLRSLCPVTGQPDWGSVVLRYRGAKIVPESLLKYVISYREHQDFHEQCVERIYRDVMACCKPEALTVYARYVRRGGLDISPYRSSEILEEPVLRLIRQ